MYYKNEKRAPTIAGTLRFAIYLSSEIHLHSKGKVKSDNIITFVKKITIMSNEERIRILEEKVQRQRYYLLIICVIIGWIVSTLTMMG